MNHSATQEFWKAYGGLPAGLRDRADRQSATLKSNPQHPSLQFKKLGERHGQEVWSARVSLQYRALALKRPGGYLWFWIGDHRTYKALISGR